MCEDARKDLTEIDVNSPWEVRAEIALDHLKKKTIEFCGVEIGFGSENIKGFPPYVQRISEIVGIVDFDVVHEHGPYHFFWKYPIVMQYVINTVGENDKYRS